MTSVLVQLNIRTDNFLLCENTGNFWMLFPYPTKYIWKIRLWFQPCDCV